MEGDRDQHPKTLREILPTLFNLLLGCLASANYDKRQVAARTLGDLVRKLGERVLPEIIPILEKGLDSDDKDKRQVTQPNFRNESFQFILSLTETNIIIFYCRVCVWV